jgi:catechol 2,3-dioxygenase-like lactoylglutathione lyase family enzyme
MVALHAAPYLHLRAAAAEEQDMSNANPDARHGLGPPLDMALEVVVIPVSNVERAKRFYGDLGWRLDLDFDSGRGYRVIQFTPPGSGCSVTFGQNVTRAAPGSTRALHLVVSDIEAARENLLRRGVEVSAAFHDAGGIFHRAGLEGRTAGPNPQHKSYASYFSFEDPDGNGWVVQEVTARLGPDLVEGDARFTPELVGALLHRTARVSAKAL